MHGNHTGGLLDANGAAVFPEADVYVSAPERSYWEAQDGGNGDLARKVFAAYGERVKTFAFGDSPPPGILALDACGHTPVTRFTKRMCRYKDSETRSIFYTYGEIIMEEIKTMIETLPLKSNTEQKNNHYIPVWEYAGEILKKYDLERNGELQYALFKWLRKHNTQETGGLCEDGFFDYGATVMFPADKENILRACTISIELNREKVENRSFLNDVAIIGNDSGNGNLRSSAIKRFYAAALRAGYREGGKYNRIIYNGNFLDYRSVTKSGNDVITLLKKHGSRDNPITGIFFSTHGTPYAIDFHNPGNNLYIPENDMRGLYERAGKGNWNPGRNAAYVDFLSDLAADGIIAADVTITLCGCLNGATGRDVPQSAEAVSLQWAKENTEHPKNIAWYISKAMPRASVIANTTQVDSGQGLNSPVMYKEGEVIA